MPEFTYPHLLWSLPAIPLLLWCWLRRSRRGVAYSHLGLVRGLPTGRVKWAKWVGLLGRALVLTCLVLAVSGPRWPDMRTRVATQGIAIMMVVDVSGSMAEQDFSWHDELMSRLEAVKRVFKLLVAGGEGPDGHPLEGRSNDLIGLVAFATRPETVCPLTLSHSVLLQLLEALQPRRLPDESQTNIGDALAWSLHALERSDGLRRVVILLTDGQHNVPPPALKPRQAAQLAASLRTSIYVIQAGTDTRATENAAENRALSLEDRQAIERTLQQVADMTGGQRFTAQDVPGLIDACRSIDALERQKIQSFQYRRYWEAYPWLGLVSFVFMVGIRVLELVVWPRLP